MPSSIRREATRAALITALLQIIAAGCEPTGPVDPTDGNKLLVPEASLMVGVSSLTASPVSWSEIDLSWPTSPSASGYQVFRSTGGATGGYSLIATTGANVGNYANTGLTGSTQYCYEIRSFKNVGRNTNYSAYSSAVCATTSSPPVVAPAETNAVPQANQILITWKDNSADEDGFHVESAPSAFGPWGQAANASANATSANVTATPEQQVCFRVIAFNAIGPSLPSASDCTALPASPTYLELRAYDVQSISLSWADNSVVEDGYRISRLEAGGVWTDIATLPTNSGSYRDVGLTPNVTYTYRVQALKDGGYSDVSNEASAIIPTSIPAPPTNAYASFSGGWDPYPYLYLFISWSDNSSNEDGFGIDWSPDGVTDWIGYAWVAANTGSFFQDIGTEGWPSSGCFRVSAVNFLGGSEPSNVTCAQAEPPTTPANSRLATTGSVPAPALRPRIVVTDRRGPTNPARVKPARAGTR